MMRALLEMLFEAGRLIVASSRQGAVSLYCFMSMYLVWIAKVRIFGHIAVKDREINIF
jgi:hypothetical protein